MNTSDEHISYKFVANLLGVTSTEIVKEYLNAIVENDSNKGLRVVNRLWDEGMDVNTFLEESIKILRNALILRLGAQNVLLDMMDEDKSFVTNLSNLLDSNRIVSVIKMLIDTANQIRWTRFPKVLLEINTIKLCDMQMDTSFEGLNERVKKLEIKLSQILENPSLLQSLKTEKTLSLSTAAGEKSGSSEVNKEKMLLPDADVSEVLERWAEVKEAVKEEKPGLSQVLQSASIKFENGLKICFKEEDSVFAELLKRNLDYFKSVLKKVVGYDGEVEVEVNSNSSKAKQEPQSDEEIMNKLKSIFPDTEITIKE